MVELIARDVFKCTVKTKDTSMRARVPFFSAIDDLLADHHVTAGAHKVTLAKQNGYEHTLLVSYEATVLYERTREMGEVRVGAGPKTPTRYRNTAKITIIAESAESRGRLLDSLEELREKYA
jgi:hypothetical protein